MTVLGIDYSTRYIDCVSLSVDADTTPSWVRFPLTGLDAFDRARSVADAMPSRSSSFFDDVLAVGIEHPAGYHGAATLLRIQGAILGRIPARMLVQHYPPARWRVLAGLSGHASKDEIRARSLQLGAPEWHPQDAHDAHLLARAIRADLDRQRKAAA